MANYEAAFTTNEFRVKDLDALKAWVELQSANPNVDELAGDRYSISGYCPIPNDRFLTAEELSGYQSGTLTLPEGCTLKAENLDEDTSLSDIGLDFDFAEELFEFLENGEQLIVTESGHEKLRYVGGWSTFIGPEGERRYMDLNNIAAKHPVIYWGEAGEARNRAKSALAQKLMDKGITGGAAADASDELLDALTSIITPAQWAALVQEQQHPKEDSK